MELDEGRAALGVHQPEGVHSEAFHHPQRPRDRPVGHDPHDHVHAFGGQGDVVPEGVVGGLGLGELAVGILLGGVDQVGELDGVLDEEDGDVVPHQVEIALLGVELHRKAADVARQVGRALVAGDRREAREHRNTFAGPLQEIGGRQVGQRVQALEEAMSGRAPGVDDPLGNALVVEVHDLFAQDEVLQQDRPPRPGLQRILVVADGHALVGGQLGGDAIGLLVQLAPGADQDGNFAGGGAGRGLGHGGILQSPASGRRNVTNEGAGQAAVSRLQRGRGATSARPCGRRALSPGP